MGPWNKPERRSLVRGFMPRKPVDRRRAERDSSGLPSGDIDLKQRKDWSILADKMISSRGIYIDDYAPNSYYDLGAEVSFPVFIKAYKRKNGELSYMLNIQKISSSRGEHF